MRPTLKRHDKGWIPNVSTIVPHLHRWGIQTVSPTRRATPIRRVSLSMKVPTLLFGTQLSQTPDSGREAVLKHARRCWLSTGTKVATAEEHWISSQFICLWVLEGRTRFRSSQARTASSSSCFFVDWRRMSLPKQILAAREDRNAGSARSAALRNPRPPYRKASLACDQLLSSKLMLHNASVVERVITSYSERSSGWWWHVADRSVGRRRVREKAFFSRKRPGWPSSKRIRSFILFVLRQFINNTASRRISQDGRSQKIHLGKLGNLDFWEQFVEAVDYAREFSRCKANVDYLVLLRVNYEAYPLKSSDAPLHIAEDRFREPQIVASSRYQTFSSESTPLAIWSTASENGRGPIGSPCWTPVDEVIEWPEAMTYDGWILIILNIIIIIIILNIIYYEYLFQAS